MRSKIYLFSILLACLWCHGIRAEDPVTPFAYVELDGTINPGSAAFIEAALRQAEEKKLQGLIIRLDTPGGLLSSTRDIIRYFSAARIPVVVFVGPGGARATSAGAILSVAAHFTAMAPGTNIGAAAPVSAGGKDIMGDMEKKVKNDTAAMVRAQARLRGRSETETEQMVLESKSHSEKEAAQRKIVDATVADLASLLALLDGKKIVLAEGQAATTLQTKGLTVDGLVKINMSLGQKLLHFVADPTISTALLALGGMALYAEISSGFTLLAPGVIAVLCFLLAFVSLQTLPINIGGLLLMLVGMAMLVAEAFVTSFGLLAIGGLAAVAAGALFLIDTNAADIKVSLTLLIPLLSGIAFVIASIAYMLARDRLRNQNSGDPLLAGEARVLTVAVDGLSGTIQAGGEIWRFESKSPIALGKQVRIIRKNGLVLHVENRS